MQRDLVEQRQRFTREEYRRSLALANGSATCSSIRRCQP
jgi:hypothetical protein